MKNNVTHHLLFSLLTHASILRLWWGKARNFAPRNLECFSMSRIIRSQTVSGKGSDWIRLAFVQPFPLNCGAPVTFANFIPDVWQGSRVHITHMQLYHFDFGSKVLCAKYQVPSKCNFSNFHFWMEHVENEVWIRRTPPALVVSPWVKIRLKN